MRPNWNALHATAVAIPADRARVGPWLLLVMLPLALHWPHWSGWLSENPAFVVSGLAEPAGAGRGVLAGYPGWIDGNAGVTLQALGGLAARDWLAGSVPWWNPYAGVGLPLAAEGQNGAFFLPFVLLLRLFDGVVYLKIVLQVVAGLACYALLRELALARLAALTGALCFELNGTFAWFGHGPILPIAFLPMLLFGIERARRCPRQGAACVGLAIGWSLLAGFPETAYLDGLLGLAWLGVRVSGTRDKRGLLAAAIAGGAGGVLLAAPPLLAFAQSLPISFVGNHQDFSGATFTPASRAALLLPYLFGPPMYGGLHLTGAAGLGQFVQWFKTAGYLDLPLVALAVMAIRWRARETALRWMLAGWTVCVLSRASGVPWISAAVNLVPLVRNTMFHLYAVPSCQMAITVLAACALDDWQGGRLERGRALWCGVATVGFAAALIPDAWPAITLLRSIPFYGVYPLVSAGMAVASVALLAVLLRGSCDGRRRHLLGGLVAGQAALLFVTPLLAGTPHPRGLDRTAMAFLAAQPGAVRVHSVGVLAPNYGAWFGVGAIDHNYLPVPQAWVDDVRATLLPGMDGVNNFAGDAGPAGLAALRDRLAQLAAHGVTHVVLPASARDAFAEVIAVPQSGQGSRPSRLDVPLDGVIAGRRVHRGEAREVTIDIGTYAGVARGTLEVRLCQAGVCVAGSADLAHAADNADLVVSLDRPLPLVPGADIAYRIGLRSDVAAQPPAIWLWPAPAADTAETVRPGLAPRIGLHLAPPADAPALIYADQSVAIYRVTHPASYAAASGCTVVIRSRTVMTATCLAPARMRRLELAYPGWRVTLNGTAAPLGRDGIYQSVLLPAGTCAIVFTYMPPGAGLAWIGSITGAAAILVFVWLGWRGGRSSGRRAMIGRSTHRLIA